MKPLLLFFLLLAMQASSAQSFDYVSVRKKNGRSLKNFYTGSAILFQTVDGNYFEGPIKAIRNDSVFILLYDIRSMPTPFGTYTRDTVAVSTLGVHFKEIKRIRTSTRRHFLRNTTGPLLMIGGAGYLTLNILNGALFNLPITDKKNLRTLGTAAGAVGLGYLITKLVSTDGFSKKRHQLVYVDL